MKKISLAALAAIALLLTVVFPSTAAADTSWLSGHVQNVGWTDAQVQAEEPRVATVGTTGKSLRLEALRINDIDSPLVLRGHVQNIGWGDESRVEVGTTGRALRLEAVQVRSSQPGWGVVCQAHVQNLGWLTPVSNGATCGTTGLSYRLEAVRIWVVPVS